MLLVHLCDSEVIGSHEVEGMVKVLVPEGAEELGVQPQSTVPHPQPLPWW